MITKPHGSGPRTGRLGHIWPSHAKRTREGSQRLLINGPQCASALGAFCLLHNTTEIPIG